MEAESSLPCSQEPISVLSTEPNEVNLECNVNTGCSFCRLIRGPEHLIGRHCGISRKTEGHSFRWSPDLWVCQPYAIECDRSFYCALFCVSMIRVSQCPISLRSGHPVHSVNSCPTTRTQRRSSLVYQPALHTCWDPPATSTGMCICTKSGKEYSSLNSLLSFICHCSQYSLTELKKFPISKWFYYSYCSDRKAQLLTFRFPIPEVTV
jgi:hypothetical protein